LQAASRAKPPGRWMAEGSASRRTMVIEARTDAVHVASNQ